MKDKDIIKDTVKEKIIPVNVEDEMRDSYMLYAMSVIKSRALPDVRDGLKPVQRRILMGMHDLNLYYGQPYRKSAKITGDVSGNYHPHGSQVIYPTLVRMAQGFANRHPLVDGQGNFGSVDGDPPAAERYTEARFAEIASEMLRDIKKQTVDFVDNYDGSRQEPVVMPAAIPHLLVNGATGIAVGMATNIPPHNLGEVIDGVVMVIDNPACDVADLCQVIKGPDFPTGAFCSSPEAIKAYYKTGRGSVVMKAKMGIEEMKGGRERLIISELPYAVNKSSLVEQIASLVREKRLEGISDLRDESDKEGMRVVIELRKGENAQVVSNNLFRYTQLRSSYNIIMLALTNNRPRVMDIREILGHYLDHRFEVLTRRTRYELAQAEQRAHILEGYKIAVKNLDAVVKLIRASRNRAEAMEKLAERFKLTQVQAQAIVDMRLHQLTSMEVKALEQEYLELIKNIERLRSLLASRSQMMGLIKEDLLRIKEKYADERRTVIVEKEEEVSTQDLIVDEVQVVSVSHQGYIKRTALEVYRRQKRGGKGSGTGESGRDDFIEHLFLASTHSYMLVFSDLGKAYWVKVYELPEGGRYTRGKAIVNLINIGKQEKITAVVPVRDLTDDKSYLLMATERGYVKRCLVSDFSNPRRNGIIAISLEKEDKLIRVRYTLGKEEAVIATAKGKAIRFLQDEVRCMGRSGRGVRGIKLAAGDKVVSLALTDKRGSALLTVCERGYGKRTKFASYRVQSRGGKGITNAVITERNGQVVAALAIDDNDELIIMAQSGMSIREAAKEIKLSGRSTQGVRLIKLKPDDKIVAVAKVAKEEN